MNPTTDWTTPVAILVAAIVLGALFVYFFNTRKKSAPAIDRDLERKDLEFKRDALIAQLRALPEDAVDERARLEAETADVLKRLDGMSAAPAPVAASAPATAMNPTVKGFLWGAGSCAALAVLLLFVYQKMTPRAEGDVATGGFPGQQQQQQQPQQAADPMVQQLEAAVQRDPNNNQLRLDLAQLYLERDNLMGVFEQTRVVLEREPQNARALTFNALVRMAMGEAETAEQMLEQATASDPQNLDSRVALAWVYAQTNRMSQAETAIAEAARISPENKGRLEQVLAQMKANAAQEAQMAQGGANAMPEGHPPVGGQPAGLPPAAAGGARIKVTLQLDPAAKPKTGIVFVIARPLTGGPPVAVKRMQVGSFPVTFDLTSADSMMGQPLPEKFRLEARLDSDGDASTKPPTDPSAMQAEVNSGAAVTLALK